MMRATTYSGGGLKLGLQLPHALAAQDDEPGTVHRYGTSCGALVAACLATRQVDMLVGLVAEVSTRYAWLRVPSVSSPALHRWRGIQSLAPLRKQLFARWDLSRLVDPLHVGAIHRETGEHHHLEITKDTPKGVAVASLLASCAIAGVFEPVRIPGREGLWCDGGHMFLAPVPVGHDAVDLVTTRPLDVDDRPTCKVDGLVDAWSFALDMAAVAALGATLGELRTLVAEGAAVRVWAPSRLIGTTLQSDAEIMEERATEGLAMMARPPVVL